MLKAAVERELLDMIQAEGRAVRGWTRREFLAEIEPELRTDAAEQESMDQLQRRIAKLNHSLEAAEQVILSLQRAARLDPGVASIYRSIQGLQGLDEEFDTKYEMLTNIFQDNLSLRQVPRSEAPAAQTTER